MPGKMLKSDKKEPTFELLHLHEGDKWCVEYHRSSHDLVIENAQMRQAVFVHKCEDCTLLIKGKVKRIVIDDCSNLSLKFESVLSGLEVYNSQKIAATVNGMLSTASVIKTSRFQLDLSEESQQCEISASCSSDIYLSYPKADGSRGHFHIPEQTRTTWNGEKFVTRIDQNS